MLPWSFLAADTTLSTWVARLLDVVFGAVHEDPPVVLLAALGEDFRHLEDQLP